MVYEQNNTKYWIMDPSTGCHQPAGHLQDDQMDGYHLRTQMESMSMEDTDSCSEYGDSHTHHTQCR